MKAREVAYKRGCSSHKFLRGLIQKAIRSSKRRYIDEKLNSEQNSKEWWDTIKLITNSKNRKCIPEYAVIDGERLNNHQLSTKLNDHYKSVGGEAVQLQSSSYRPEQRLDLDPLSIGEVKHLINQLDTSKATSGEDFPTWLSKEGKEDICIPLHDIINCMLGLCLYFFT